MNWIVHQHAFVNAGQIHFTTYFSLGSQIWLEFQFKQFVQFQSSYKKKRSLSLALPLSQLCKCCFSLGLSNFLLSGQQQLNLILDRWEFEGYHRCQNLSGQSSIYKNVTAEAFLCMVSRILPNSYAQTADQSNLLNSGPIMALEIQYIFGVSLEISILEAYALIALQWNPVQVPWFVVMFLVCDSPGT